MATREVELKRGLKDVYLDTTEASEVIGDTGQLFYRGYNIHDLAEHSTFEECVFLLMMGHLPTRSELDQFEAALRSSRGLPPEILDIIDRVKQAHPMDVLRTAVSALSAFDPDTENISEEATLRKGTRLTAQVATIVTAHQSIRNGRKPTPPDPSLNHAGNFLYMLLGERLDEETTRLMDKDFIVHLDHGANASAFAARVTASTQADLHGAVVSGISTLKGPLHGGAAEGVMKMAEGIGSVENAQRYVEGVLSNGGRVMGYGHPVYRAVDPRSIHLKADAKSLGERKGQPKWFSILQAVTTVMEPYAKRGLHPNVDLWSGAIYSLLDIPDDLFIPIFALGRIPGWTAHVMEQYSRKDILRPRLLYNGPTDLEYLPIEQRS